MRDLSSLTPEINPGPLELGVQSFNHWTTSEVSSLLKNVCNSRNPFCRELEMQRFMNQHVLCSTVFDNEKHDNINVQ